MTASLAIVIAYLVGSVPVAHVTARWTSGVDLREHGSGNIGASNISESVSRPLMIVVGLAQIAQGLAAVLIARALDQGEGVQAAAGVAAVIANDWNPWLRFHGGRGIGTTIGVLLALSPWALAAFVVVAVAGAVIRMVPQAMALALALTPVAAWAADDPRTMVAACVLLAAIALVKRVLANGAPDASTPHPQVWMNRLLLDRDIRDRELWVRRSDVHHGGAETRKGS